MVAAEHVDHHRPRRPGPRVAERQVEDGAQVLLELARHGAVDAPVTAVVRAHRQLVDHDTRRPSAAGPRTSPPRARRRHRAHRRSAARSGSPRRPGPGPVRVPARAPRCRRPRTGRSRRRPGRRLPDGLRATRTASSRRKATPPRRAARRRRRQSGRTRQSASASDPTTQHALAVVAAAGGLQHDRPAADRVGELGQSRPRSPTSAQRGIGTPSSASRRRITALSWACTSAAGPGRTGTPSALERVQQVGRHVLVVEGEHVAGLARTRSPRRRPGGCPPWSPAITWAALSSDRSARTARRTPSATAAGWVIRASWPPPTMPTSRETGRRPPGMRSRAPGYPAG